MGTFTAAIPSFTVERAKASELQTLADLATALTAADGTWTPTYSNLTTTGATISLGYRQIGKWVDYYWQFIFGSGSAVGTMPSLTLPVAPASRYSTGSTGAFPGQVHLLDSGTADRQGTVKISSGSTIVVYFWNATPTLTNVTSTAPWTWATGDTITIAGTYMAA